MSAPRSVSRSRLLRPRRHRARALGLLTTAALVLSLGVVSGSASADDETSPLDMYRATLSATQLADLGAKGVDIAESKVTGKGVRADLVLDAAEVDQLRSQGVKVKLLRNNKGQSARQAAAAQAASGYNVWRSFDEPGGIRDELYRIAKDNPQLVKLVVLGRTHQGREIIALKVTQGARGQKDGSRPAALFSSTQHAREWISTEVNRRLLNWFIDRSRANDKEIKNLLKERELWFVVVANPDGYQYTFDNERLWRKNLRDNDGDGQISGADGVDPNRNYPEHWGYDEEGSSQVQSSATYRGPTPASEPETQAMMSLYERVPFTMHVNYHSYGPYLLYPEGWQIGTPSGDDPIYYALSGNRDEPAIEDSVPGLSADVLYVTNGETTDYAHIRGGALAWTPELEPGCPGCGFVFPDDEALVQAQFEKTLPFNLDVVKSAADPANPSSHLGIETKPFYLKSDDTYKAGLPQADFTFETSYGDPQEVRVLAKRSLGAVSVKYRVNGGAVQTAPTTEWDGGDRYGGKSDVYYHVMRGNVTGTSPGDSVEVWFAGGGQRSDSFTYDAAVESGNDVLVLAAEDYSGASPGPSPGPKYLDYYTKALADNGIGYDVYDVDAMGRTAATNLGVLSHYEGVVWYTGDDAITREPGWGPGNASRLAMDEMLNARDFMNEGGRVFYTGKYAGHQFAGGHGTQRYDPTAANGMCSDPSVSYRCLALRGSGDGVNDVLEYWLGAYTVNEGAGQDENGDFYDVLGVDEPLDGLTMAINGGDSANNQDHSASFITTSGILDPATYPQFRSWPAAKYDRPGGPFTPHTGDYYVYSQIGDVSYKRLTRTFDVAAGADQLSFWLSTDIEHDWDYVFVEARTPGGDDWTTLPDLNGHTSQSTGASCPAGWRDLHPQLDHYQTLLADGTCTSTGSSGVWNASSDSDGWQEWAVDLGAYAGGQVELSIAYVSDWGTQGLGIFVDDVTGPGGQGTTSFEEDADPMDGWAITGPPPGSAPNPNNWVRTTAGGFPEAAVVGTDVSLLAGFGFEGIRDSATRAETMRRAVDFLTE